MGVILSAFLLPKMAFLGDLGCFEGLDGEIVRSDGENGSWVAKNAFSGCSLGIRGFTHVSPYNPDVVGSPTASVFHSIERGCRHPLHVNYNFFGINYNFTFWML
jgi:hypothetical protein